MAVDATSSVSTSSTTNTTSTAQTKATLNYDNFLHLRDEQLKE
ncbi:flagellar biosynthesis protein FlgD, partial [Rhizobium leguminosarum]